METSTEPRGLPGGGSDLFHRDRDDDGSGILRDIQGRSALLVAFGGIAQGLGVPVFEFFRSLSAMDCDKVFIRDKHQAWYHRGVDDDIETIDALRGELTAITSRRGYSRVCFLGNSMGGYAAILFGLMVGADAILAFAPQTFVDRKHRWLHRDRRWKRQIRGVHRAPNKRADLLDLQPLVRRYSHSSVCVRVFYATDCRLDRVHADRLANIRNVELNPLDEGRHQVVKVLRRNGVLQRLLNESLIGPSGTPVVQP